MNKQAIVFWAFIVLAALGVIGLLGRASFSSILIPLIVFGVVFLLYKYPPARWSRKAKTPKIKPSAKTMAKVNAQNNVSARKSSSSKKRKDYPFQVIQGQKGKSNEEDIPKYH
ncbi:hypothetical protein ABIE27_000825 [Paenibacillus sp. 4624]|jgi:hypothetical protein|uniref:DUF2207 domain-containing protein n=1 Tax=Paenibacillus amylolyticus TaxID=1451 RepID=A0A5M9WJF3_PAEAM|nr:hypothetical protein [Paenibacillus amylolyticus]KAA8782317.1 hypothetical protein EC604_00460 [Paenibacillus amylolyticus]